MVIPLLYYIKRVFPVWLAVFFTVSHGHEVDLPHADVVFGNIKHPSSYEKVCGEDCFDIPEWYEIYDYYNEVVYVVNADGSMLSAYKDEVLLWKRFLPGYFTGAVDFVVGESGAFYLDQGGYLYRVSLSTGEVIARSARVREGDYEHISLGGYSLGLLRDSVVVRDKIKGHFFCFNSEDLVVEECSHRDLEKKADHFLVDGWFVRSVLGGYELYGDDGEFNDVLRPASDRLEAVRFTRDGGFFILRKDGEMATMYFIPWHSMK